MTTRNRERIHDPEMTVYRHYNQGGLYSSRDQAQTTRTETMSDTLTPGWRDKIARGDVVNSPLDYWSRTRTFSSWTAKYRAVSKSDPSVYYYSGTTGNWSEFTIYGVYQPWIGNPLTTYPDNAKAEAIAKQKCLANVDATPYEFFEDLAEVGETIRFLRHPLQSLTNLAKAFKQQKREVNRIRDALERAKALAAIWNTYRFAAAPLVRSLMTAMEAFNDRDVKRPKRRRASGRGQDTITGEPENLYAGPLVSNMYMYWTKVGARAVDYHAYIGYEVENPLVDMFFKLGLRLKDVPVVAWEILPLSFMLDRLYNIKDMISGLINIADPNVTFVYGGVAMSELSKYEYSVTMLSHPSYTVTVDLPDVITWMDFHKTRGEWSPTFLDTFPVFTPEGLVRDITTTLDLIAILISILPSAPK